MRKSDVSIQINQITIQIYLRSYDISVINPLIEENMFLQMFDLTCISLLRAQSRKNSDNFKTAVEKIYTPYIGAQQFLPRIWTMPHNCLNHFGVPIYAHYNQLVLVVQ